MNKASIAGLAFISSLKKKRIMARESLLPVLPVLPVFSTWNPSIGLLSVFHCLWSYQSVVHSEDYTKPTTLLKERHGNPMLHQLSHQSPAFAGEAPEKRFFTRQKRTFFLKDKRGALPSAGTWRL